MDFPDKPDNIRALTVHPEILAVKKFGDSTPNSFFLYWRNVNLAATARCVCAQQRKVGVAFYDTGKAR